MDRYLQNTAATLSITVQVDGTATNPAPDSALVTVTRADGTVLVNNQAAADGGTGIFTYTLTPAETALLDTLTAVWTFTLDGLSQSLRTTAEIVGGFLFSIADARAVAGLEDTTLHPTSKIVEKRTVVEGLLERACGFAFVPRYTRETVSGTGAYLQPLRWPFVRAVRSISVDSIAYTAGELADVVVTPYEGIYGPNRWTVGYSNVIVGYEHGEDHLRPGAREAALTWAKQLLLTGPLDDRATGLITQEGTVNYLTPGVRGVVSGLPFVDAFIQSNSLHVGVA